MRDYFEWGGVNTLNYGVHVFFSNVDAAAVRVYEPMNIPGRNGALLMDEGRYADAMHEYDLIATDPRALEKLRADLLQVKGYKRLEDSFHPDEFYAAWMPEMPETVMNPHRDLSRMHIIFQRRPERFLKSGEQVLAFSSNGAVVNPTGYEAKPLIRIYGDGAVEIGAITVTTTGVDGYVDIDTETMQAYKGALPMNNRIAVSGLYMPTLHAGTTGISLTDVTVEITPRWWKL